MPEIIPAIMPQSFTELREHFELVDGLVRTVQLDVMDGVFVPAKSWPYTDGDYEGFMKMAKEKESLTELSGMDFEVDLMVKNPETEIVYWLAVGASRVIVHLESTKVLPSIISFINDQFHERKEIDSFSKPREFGIALDILTPNKAIEALVREIDFVQYMGIAKIGFQGEPFDERVLEKIKDFRDEYADVTISVDGGVSLESAPRLVEAGVNRLVVGSAIWKSENLEDTIEQFKNI